MFRVVIVITGTILLAAAAHAADPVAMVEEASSGGALQSFDYLSAGQTIALGPHERIVIDYFASCLRETITGGAVTVGAEKSTVVVGKVQRQRVACDGKLAHQRGQIEENAIVVFRHAPREATSPTDGDRRIYALCPVVSVAGIDNLKVERLDQPEAPFDIALSPDNLRFGRYYDFAAAGGCPFVAGGTYRLSGGGRSILLTIDTRAKRSRGSLLSRLLVL